MLFAIRVAVRGSLPLGDLTGAGRADIAALDFDGLVLFERNSGRSFQRKLFANSCGSTDSPVVIADINGDGRNDVAMGCYANIVYYLGRPDGTLDSFVRPSRRNRAEADPMAHPRESIPRPRAALGCRGRECRRA